MKFPDSIDREKLFMAGAAVVGVLFCICVIGAISTLYGRGGSPQVAAAVVSTGDEEFVGPIAPEDALASSHLDDDALLALDESGLPADASDAFIETPEPNDGTTVVSTGELQRGDSLASAMARAQVPANVVHLVTSRTADVFNYRHSQPGHRFDLIQDLDGRVLDFRYWTSPMDSVHMVLDGDDYAVERVQADLHARVARIAGVVDSSLYAAINALGERPQLAYDFTDVFAWDVDFSRTVKRGDEFRVLYERMYYTDPEGNEVYVGPGRILAAQYGGAVGSQTAVYFETEEGRGGYYRPDGSAMEREFLLAPVRYTRISSNYSSARHHPILKVTRPHHGIDYVAKSGTPVWAVADGEVIYRGWGGGFGNLIKVRHKNGYVSYYTHLSRFASRLKVGDFVQQKQVIGYVGMTGLATGPHTCFRIAKDGRYVNPASLRSKFPVATPIAEAVREDFYAVRDTLLSELDGGPMVATAEAL